RERRLLRVARRDRRAGARGGLLAVGGVVLLERGRDLELARGADEHEALEQLPVEVGVDLETLEGGLARAQRLQGGGVLGRGGDVREELHELELRIRTGF